MERDDRAEERKAARKLLLARMDILARHGFFGMLLMDAPLGLTKECPTAYTDGRGIYVNPSFIEGFSVEEVGYLLLHEALHIALDHCGRRKDLDKETYDIAADIVVNSTILYSLGMRFEEGLLLGKGTASPVSMIHVAPDGREGHLCTAEEVYAMLPKGKARKGASGTMGGMPGMGSAQGGQCGPFFDDHSYWKPAGEEEKAKILSFGEEYMRKQKADAEFGRKGIGRLPANLERTILALHRGKVDWRLALQEFLQLEISDYSFLPPDRRHQEDFFLPDFNDMGDPELRNIVFLVDVSGSISRKILTAFFSEARSLVDQFKGKVSCWIGIFDAMLQDLVPFSSMSDVGKIKMKGGGGTNLFEPLEQVFRRIQEDSILAFVVMTDGLMVFPGPKEFRGKPVLWAIPGDEESIGRNGGPSYGQVVPIN